MYTTNSDMDSSLCPCKNCITLGVCIGKLYGRSRYNTYTFHKVIMDCTLIFKYLGVKWITTKYGYKRIYYDTQTDKYEKLFEIFGV